MLGDAPTPRRVTAQAGIRLPPRDARRGRALNRGWRSGARAPVRAAAPAEIRGRRERNWEEASDETSNQMPGSIDDETALHGQHTALSGKKLRWLNRSTGPANPQVEGSTPAMATNSQLRNGKQDRVRSSAREVRAESPGLHSRRS